MPSLKREDAVARRALLDVRDYRVDLDLTTGPEVFGSTVTIRFSCTEPGADTFVEIQPAALRSVTLNGRDLPVDQWRDGRFPLADLAADNELTMVADMAYSHSGEGLHRFSDPEDGLDYTYMMGFLDMASRVFGCFEQPDLKAPYRLSVTAPPEWTVVANESGEQTEPGRWVFRETKPLSTYFVTLVAGPYHSLYREHDGVRFGIHARQSYAEALDTDADEIFEVTHGCWDRFHELYGIRYAFGDSYDQCFVPEFNAGAMENPGCVTFRDEAFMFRSAVTEAQRARRAAVIAHEMAHMWFGDLVSMRWWDDLWLNESFADCMGHRGASEGTRFTTVRSTAVVEGLRGYQADQRPSTHPVSGDVPESGEALNNFDGISYAKGGAILDQLAAWLGDEAFFAGLRDYFERYRYGNASLADLMDCFARSSGKDLSDWAQRWLRTTGPNTLRLVSEQSDGRYTAAAIEQTAAAEHPTLRPHHLHLGLYNVVDGTAVRTGRLTVDIDGARTEVPDLIGQPVPDLLLVNDDSLTYAKSRLDAASLSAVPAIMATLTDPVARAMLWGILVDMVRDGELTPGRYLEILAETLPGEKQVSQVEIQLGFARGSVVDRYLPPAQRPAGLAAVSALAQRLCEDTDTADDIRLEGLRMRIRCARTEEDIAYLRGLLAGTGAPSGIIIDNRLRWAILVRLAVLGVIGEAEIDAELAADPSSEGHKSAATCRAALPTAEAKAAAWRIVMDDRELSNHLLVATAAGFWWPEQADLTVDYEERYFRDAPAGLGARLPWDVIRVGHTLFPFGDVSGRTVEAAEEMLARHDLVPELRRLVVDDLDDLKRALRARNA